MGKRIFTPIGICFLVAFALFVGWEQVIEGPVARAQVPNCSRALGAIRVETLSRRLNSHEFSKPEIARAEAEYRSPESCANITAFYNSEFLSGGWKAAAHYPHAGTYDILQYYDGQRQLSVECREEGLKSTLYTLVCGWNGPVYGPTGLLAFVTVFVGIFVVWSLVGFVFVNHRERLSSQMQENKRLPIF
jgi:hypothetical protein